MSDDVESDVESDIYKFLNYLKSSNKWEKYSRLNNKVILLFIKRYGSDPHVSNSTDQQVIDQIMDCINGLMYTDKIIKEYILSLTEYQLQLQVLLILEWMRAQK